MQNGNNGVKSAYFKLETPKPVDSGREWDTLANKQEECLISNFSDKFIIEKNGERIAIHETIEEPCYETNFKVAKYGGFDSTILEKVEKFLDQQNDMPLPCRGTLIFHSPFLFDNRLILIMADFQAHSIHFGNIYRNEFYDHWEVSYGPNKNSEGLKYERKIFVNFEFDKPEPIIVTFRHMELDEKRCQEGKMDKYVMHYELKIKKEWIRRIICDPAYETEDLESDYSNKLKRRTRLYFELNAPIMIRKGRNLFSNEKQGVKPRFFDRVLTIRGERWGVGGKVESHPSAITDSPFFFIEFDRQINNVELYTILSRLRLRSEVPIEFVRIEKYPGNVIFSLEKSPYHKWTTTNLARVGTTSPTDPDEKLFHDFLENVFVYKRDIDSKRHKERDKLRERKFAYVYLIECLLSRGASVKNQLLLDEKYQWFPFLCIIKNHFNDDITKKGEPRTYNLCESALEDLINFLDGKKRYGDLLTLFERLCEQRKIIQESNQITASQYDEGYRKIRKVVLTPTRKILIVPETVMSNRVLNSQDHDSTRILRVSFRDDDNRQMRSSMLGELLSQTIYSYLRDGIQVGMRDFGYLGSSNSQMRDNGAYFMEKCSAYQLREYLEKHKRYPPLEFKPKILNFREQLGKFQEAESIPKAMARLGQCFTQARLCFGVDIDRTEYFITCDIKGGKNEKREAYTYTDGVGMISEAMATQVARQMKLGKSCVPSAYQIRFRGMKGMIAIEPLLDSYSGMLRDINNNGEKERKMSGLTNGFLNGMINGLNRDEENKNTILDSPTYKCIFRPSQVKFTSSKSKDNKYQIELVKFSAPTPVALNRPFINILDHVSEMQSLNSHRKICERIEELLDKQMASFAKYMINEDECRSRLEEMPRRVHFASLKKTHGFMLTTEPFFRSLIRSAIFLTLSKLLRKTQIIIPFSLGRSMFGVTDETGQLQYGQVFVQYTENIGLKTPSPSAAKRIIRGKVMITKCPSVVAGDVRIFEAVDIPELRHMNDVVVFPQSGPRPHPDEMAGSDLDGDEYSVIWDEDLMLDKNEEAFHFSTEKMVEPFTVKEMDAKFHDFYVKYMQQDSVGMISLNHLHQSDQYGINSEVCDSMATKLSQALDFVKSGHPPDPLTTKWVKDEETGKLIPPERAERLPDFASNGDKAVNCATYTSSRLLGTLYRELKGVDDVMKISEEREAEIVLDPMIDIEGWEKYEDYAKKELQRYNGLLRSCMENYGIKTEGEIFSGCIMDMRNRISDKEQDDMSLYNTENIIETKVTNIYRTFREAFFQEFASDPQRKNGFLEMTVFESGLRAVDEQNNVLRRVCKLPSDEMMRKAVAYYKVCYQSVIDKGERKLSFAWIAYDVLDTVRESNMTKDDAVLPMTNSNPLFLLIEEHRNTYYSENKEKYREFVKKVNSIKKSENEYDRAAAIVITKYVKKYEGLLKVLFVMDSWATVTGVIYELKNDADVSSDDLKRAASCRLKWYHVSLLLIMFATRQIGSKCGTEIQETGKSILFKLNELDDVHMIEKIGIENGWSLSDAAANRLTIGFFQFLASRQFSRLSYLSFQSVGLKSVFMRGEWLPWHRVGSRTYYNLLLNMKFEELPISTSLMSEKTSLVRESNPFVIELPSTVDMWSIVAKLEKKTNCVEIKARGLSDVKSKKRYLLSARGDVESLQMLRELVTVKVPRKSWSLGEDLSDELAKLCVYKIKGSF